MLTYIIHTEHGPLFLANEILTALGFGNKKANRSMSIKAHCPEAKAAKDYSIDTWHASSKVLTLTEALTLIHKSEFDGRKILEWMKNEGFDIHYVHTTRPEFIALSVIEQLLGITLARQVKVGPYRLDGYDPINNVAYEVDEQHHTFQPEEDAERERYITEALRCTFKRVKV